MNSIEEIDKTKLKEIIKLNALIVDVREKEEFMDFNIGGINIPAHEITTRIKEIEAFDNLIIVCSNGTRSSIMAKVVQKKIPKAIVYHLTEGIF
jgi:rhodanese-related sulfurtransferase